MLGKHLFFKPKSILMKTKIIDVLGGGVHAEVHNANLFCVSLPTAVLNSTAQEDCS